QPWGEDAPVADEADVETLVFESPVARAPAMDAAAMDALEPEFSIEEPAAAELVAMDSLGFDDVPAPTAEFEAMPQSARAFEPEPEVRPEPEPAPEPAAPSATETMADLYVQQGLTAEAIAVYRQLVEARPLDSALRERLAALESPVPVAVAA